MARKKKTTVTFTDGKITGTYRAGQFVRLGGDDAAICLIMAVIPLHQQRNQCALVFATGVNCGHLYTSPVSVDSLLQITSAEMDAMVDGQDFEVIPLDVEVSGG